MADDRHVHNFRLKDVNELPIVDMYRPLCLGFYNASFEPIFTIRSFGIVTLSYDD